jgi:hypothetical protein
MKPMAKKRKSVGSKLRKPATNDAMPYVIALVVCENILVESDQAASAVRIVDTVTLPADAANASVGEGIVLPGLRLLCITKAGDARGEREHVLRLITPESPPVAHDAATWSFTYSEPPESGQNTRIAPLQFVWAGQGLYHFELVVGGTVLAHTPIRIRVAAPDANSAPK